MVRGFDTKWDEELSWTQDVPSDNILESLYKTRLRESDQLKMLLALYNQDIGYQNMPPSYQRLKTMVKKFCKGK